MSLTSMQRIKRDAWIAAMMGMSYGELVVKLNDPKTSKEIWNERQKYHKAWIKTHIDEIKKAYKKGN